MAKQIDGGKSLWNQSQIVETHGFIVVIVVIIFLCGRNWNNTVFFFLFNIQWCYTFSIIFGVDILLYHNYDIDM